MRVFFDLQNFLYTIENNIARPEAAPFRA